MEKEITASTILGVVLIALAAVIGLSFGIFTIAKGIGNEGQLQVSESLNTVVELNVSEFDQKIVTGNRITSFYEEVKGKPIAILVSNESLNSGVLISGDNVTYTQTINGEHLLNYNALLANDNEGLIETLQHQRGGVVKEPNVSDAIISNNGFMSTKYGFVLNPENGKVEINTSIGGWGKQGSSEYINENSKYNSNIIRDESGQIVGVAFTQIKR